jgi:hypothetical protein
MDCQRAKSASETIAAGPYPGLRASTDIDLFAAFCWRSWQVMRTTGRMGLVLPRTAFSGSSLGEWRIRVLDEGSIPDLTTLLNNRGWAFEQIHPQYSICLTAIVKNTRNHDVKLRGPFSSLIEFSEGVSHSVASVPAEQVLSWSDKAVIPLLPASEFVLFSRFRRSPSFIADLGSWRYVSFRELHTTGDKKFFDFSLDKPKAGYSMPVWGGSTINLWDPDWGPIFAWAKPKDILTFLFKRRLVSSRRQDSVFVSQAGEHLDQEKSLPIKSARILLRDVTNRTNSRTVIACLAPPDVALVNTTRYLVRQRGDARTDAYILGILSSIPFDWYARRFVELHVTASLLDDFPVPRVNPETGNMILRGGVSAELATDFSSIYNKLIQISGRLAAVDARYTSWANEVGVPVGSVKTPEEKEVLVAELDALVSLLYGLSRDQVEQVFATFHRGWGYKERLQAVLEYFDYWANELGLEG